MPYTKAQVEAQLNRICEKADIALHSKPPRMDEYWQLATVRTELRVALGKCQLNRDPGDVHIDDDILNSVRETETVSENADVDDLGQD